MINTKFWTDTYISNIDPLEKLLFLYFITNPFTNICGIYELPIKQIALDTGIDRENLEKVFLPRFKKAKKIYYIDGWVYIKNFLKHQKASGNVKLGIDNGLKEVPSDIMAKIKLIDNTPPYVKEQSLKLELELEPKLKLEDSELSPLVNKVMEVFHKSNPTMNWGNKTTRKACVEMIKKFTLEKTIEMAKKVVAVQGQQFAPVATTPYQMKENLAKFKIYFDKQKSGKVEWFNKEQK
jgi:hypothetical protein